MYVTQEQAKKLVKDFSDRTSDEYKEKFEFLSKLLQDDDWSFVIKAHALIESLITELIISRIDDNLKEIIERIPLHGEVISKINIAKKYELIPSEQRPFLKKISEIRNSIVHKYENLNFSFDEYFGNLDKNSLKTWKRILIWNKMDEGITKQINILFSKSPKVAIWLTLSSFVNKCLIEINLLKGDKSIKKESKITTKELLENL